MQERTARIGRWFIDEEACSVNGLPVLFIHGIDSSSSTWIEEEDLLASTRNDGHQSVLIDLHPDEDMWRNGEILAEKLREMYAHFQQKLIIVGHSKGGIDAQAALVHYGAHPYVEQVITLSSPHHGSELADLAFSKWAGWLTGKLGSRTEAVFSLQTAYMQRFRSSTDEGGPVVPFYTFGGTGWGSAGSPLFWGGLYLSRFGQNDGAVLVKSSRLPSGLEVAVGDWTHVTIKEGKEIFQFLQHVFNGGELPAEVSVSKGFAYEEETSVLHRGGEYEGSAIERFPVEEGIERLTVVWISDRKDCEYELVSPDGTWYTVWDREADETGFFPGAHHHAISLSDPVPGQWEVRARGRGKEHYLMTAFFHHQAGIISALSGPDTGGKKTYTIHHLPFNPDSTPSTVTTAGEISSLPLADFEEGIHNITLDIEGYTGMGNIFQRTIVQTLYVDGKGNIR